MRVTAIIAAGGSGRRLGAGVPKQLLEIAGRSLLQRSVDAFRTHPAIDNVVVALPEALAAAPPRWLEGVTVVAGGEQRQESVAKAFAAIPARTDIVLVHDAARPFVTAAVISRAIEGALAHGAAIAAIPVTDTVKKVGHHASGSTVIVATLPRDEIVLAQTPQAFRTSVLRAAIAAGRTTPADQSTSAAAPATDEAMLAERAGHHVHIVAGDPGNVKITTASDLEAARSRAAASAISRVGVGYDLHRLVEGRALVLGGVTIPAERGALGHSDADVICHAVTDAVLGAARAGDIGRHYPDTDPRWKDASSVALLRDAVARVRGQGWAVANADVVVILERPKIAPHREHIERQLADALGIAVDRVSVKGKTNEGVDAVGRGEAIAAHAVCLLTAVL